MKHLRTPRWIGLMVMLNALLLVVPSNARPVLLESGSASLTADIRTWLVHAAPTDTATFIVTLRDVDGVQAQVADAQAIINRRARRVQVVQLFSAQAQRNERAVRSFLGSQGVARLASNLQFYAIINGFSITTNKQVVDVLSRWNRVKSIEKETIVTLDSPFPSEELPRINAVEWNIAKIGADRVWTELGIDGTGVVVGGLDSGVRYTHEALKDNYKCAGQSNHTACWKDAVSSNQAPTDTNDHGSHTMGSAVGRLGIGVAPGAKWIACGAFNGASASSTDILECMDWFLKPGGDVANAPDVVINSWGSGSETTDAFKNGVTNWVNAGIFPEFSIGNSGSACKTSRPPGNYTNAFGTGATDNADKIANFSSRGPSPYGSVTKPDVSAPGVSIRSAVKGNDTAYSSKSGTSMAGPHTAGLVALLLQANPNLTIAQLQENITKNALGISSNECSSSGVPNNVYGWGRIQAYESVKAAKGGAGTPTPVTPTTTPVTPTPTPVTPTPVTPTPVPSIVYSDDFESDKGWIVNPYDNDSATSGVWERGDPEPTSHELPISERIDLQLGTTSSGSNDLVTGRLAGSSAGANDLDGGVTSVQSPAFDLPSNARLTLSFNYYLAHLDNANSDDYLRVRILDIPTQGAPFETVVFEKRGQATNTSGAWASASVDLTVYAGTSIQILIEAADAGTASLLEAGIDDVVVRAGSTATPTPTPSTPTPSTPTPSTPIPTPPPATVLFFDDFETAKGWVSNAGGSDTATKGKWERGRPSSVGYNGPKQLSSTVSGVNDLATGLAGWNGSTTTPDYGDIDGGTTSIRSPAVAIGAGAAQLTFSYYFAHTPTDASDYFRVYVVSGGSRTVVFEKLGQSSDVDAAWVQQTVDLSIFGGQSIQIEFEAADAGAATTIVEVAVDNVEIKGQAPLR